MNPYQKLDEILKFIQKEQLPIELEIIFLKYNNLSWPITKKGKTEKIPSKEIERILIKLEKENFIDSVIKEGKMNNQTKHYKITFDGDFFIKKGGYEQRDKDIKLKRVLRFIEAVVLVIFSGIGAVWATFEIYDRLIKNCICN